MSAAACKAEVLLDAVDISFHNGPYFVGIIPFLSTAESCVDVTIEFEEKTYYIPATIVDVKAHTAPAGYVQTGESFSGEQAGGDKGNIVEW